MSGEKLIAVHRNYFGDIISFQTSTGRVISYQKALQEVEMGVIDGVHIEEQQDGSLNFSPTDVEGFSDYPSFF